MFWDFYHQDGETVTITKFQTVILPSRGQDHLHLMGTTSRGCVKELPLVYISILAVCLSCFQQITVAQFKNGFSVWFHVPILPAPYTDDSSGPLTDSGVSHMIGSYESHDFRSCFTCLTPKSETWGSESDKIGLSLAHQQVNQGYILLLYDQHGSGTNVHTYDKNIGLI